VGAGVDAETRLRALNLVRDLTASDLGGYLEVLAIHAEGSLEAQKLTVLMDADFEPYKAYARRLAGIDRGDGAAAHSRTGSEPAGSSP
jgi:4-hydroxybutyryl-CoA dehydratase/vinylacetyl-CoA-Delta-isomerase